MCVRGKDELVPEVLRVQLLQAREKHLSVISGELPTSMACWLDRTWSVNSLPNPRRIQALPSAPLSGNRDS
jgi:hypothetical protein